VVWSLKRFFAFLHAAGLSDVRIDGLLAHAAPRRVRALPCFTREETGCLIKGIDTRDSLREEGLRDGRLDPDAPPPDPGRHRSPGP
jgi:hypothetical protein